MVENILAKVVLADILAKVVLAEMTLVSEILAAKSKIFTVCKKL